MWEVQTTGKFEKQLRRLPGHIQRKFKKQFAFLLDDFRHPSLYAKKKGDSGAWEARVDFHYRFAFVTDGSLLTLISIGMHDEGLGKK